MNKKRTQTEEEEEKKTEKKMNKKKWTQIRQLIRFSFSFKSESGLRSTCRPESILKAVNRYLRRR